VGKWGIQGAQAPWQGAVGGVPFRPNPLAPFPAREGGKFGGVLPFTSGRGWGEANPATSGTQAAGEPKANEGGQRGSRGRSPHGRGLWGVSPHKTKRGGE